jgi:hypothetical protein
VPGLRLWSISPSYLDARGLLALWREALLAQKALMGLTRGYTRHPQLERFRRTSDPVLYIGTYLYYVYLEGRRRGYDFNLGKIVRYDPGLPRVPLTAPALNNGGSAPTGAFPLTSQAPPRARHHSSGPAVSPGEARAHRLLSSPAPNSATRLKQRPINVHILSALKGEASSLG